MVSLINMAGCMHRSYVIGPLCSRCFTEDIILCDTATAIVWSFCKSCWSAISLSVFYMDTCFMWQCKCLELQKMLESVIFIEIVLYIIHLLSFYLRWTLQWL